MLSHQLPIRSLKCFLSAFKSPHFTFLQPSTVQPDALAPVGDMLGLPVVGQCSSLCCNAVTCESRDNNFTLFWREKKWNFTPSVIKNNHLRRVQNPKQSISEIIFKFSKLSRNFTSQSRSIFTSRSQFPVVFILLSFLNLKSFLAALAALGLPWLLTRPSLTVTLIVLDSKPSSLPDQTGNLAKLMWVMKKHGLTNKNTMTKTMQRQRQWQWQLHLENTFKGHFFLLEEDS